MACALASCARGPADDLSTEFIGVRAVEGDAPATISIAVPAGSHLIEVREQGIELRAIIDAPAIHSVLEDKIPRHGLLTRVVEVSAPSTLRVELRNVEHRAQRGAAEVRVSRWKRDGASVADERELGFTAFGAASEQTALDSKESWTRAADLLHEAIAHFTTAHDDAARAQAEYTLGHLEYLARMEWTPAIRAAERAGETYAGLGDATGVQNAATLRAVAELEVASGMSAGTQRAEQKALYASADRTLTVAAEYFEKRGLPINAEYAVNMLGIRAFYEGDWATAGRFFARAADMSRVNHDPGEEARALTNLAWIHNRLGSVAQAAVEYERLLPLIEKDRQPAQYSTLLGNYGLTLIALGDFDRALALHTEALEISARIHNDAEYARQLAALGGLYFRMGDLRRALDTLRAAIVVSERVGDAIVRSAALRVAGNAASALDEHDLALEYLRKSVELDVNPHTAARTRVLIAEELRVLGDLRGADTELSRAWESDNAFSRATVLVERGRLRMAQKRYADAIVDLRDADTRFKAISLDYDRIDTNTALAQALLATNDLPGASAAADAAVNIVRSVRVKSANPEWRAHFLSARYSPYEARIAVDFATNDAKASWRAFRTAEEVRARSLADQLVGSARHGAEAIDPLGDALRTQLTSLQLRLESKLQKQDSDDKSISELRRQIVETRAKIDTQRLAHESVAVSERSLTDSLTELQAKLPDDTAVLAYFVGDNASHGWLLTRRELRHAKLAGRLAMQHVTDSLLGVHRSGEVAAVADRDAAAQLLGDLFAGVKARRLLIIPDGPLNGVPFATLPLPGGNKLLIDDYVIAYAPSLTLALAGVPTRGAHPTRVAVVSDPVYAPDDKRLGANIPGGNLRGPRAVSPNNLTRLPYSGLEARTVARAMGERDTLQLEGFDANLDRVLALSGSDLAVLHFATHAIARRDLPEQSALYLSEYTPDGTLRDDSRLTASAITRSGLHADLVVLSGCATGDGSELRGEGVLGLTYGFLANGSRSVVAALWPIEDASTARFMNEFYRAYRESGNTADALRTAQLHMRDSAKSTVWSSFVVRANAFP
jgi:CHAT domain-containing protein/Tfp pilus assembly protein PilF